MSLRRLLSSIAGAATFVAAAHAEPVRHIAITVEPYYQAAATPAGTPRVVVGRSFEGLASNKREDILAILDRIIADPKTVTPMTLMVLALRQNAAKETAYLRDPDNAAKFRAQRARNGANQQFCWKS